MKVEGKQSCKGICKQVELFPDMMVREIKCLVPGNLLFSVDMKNIPNMYDAGEKALYQKFKGSFHF